MLGIAAHNPAQPAVADIDSALLLLSLAGCSTGVLDLQGPIGAANLKITYNALAIVLPTIVATRNMLPMHQMMQMQR